MERRGMPIPRILRFFFKISAAHSLASGTLVSSLNYMIESGQVPLMGRLILNCLQYRF